MCFAAWLPFSGAEQSAVAGIRAHQLPTEWPPSDRIRTRESNPSHPPRSAHAIRFGICTTFRRPVKGRDESNVIL